MAARVLSLVAFLALGLLAPRARACSCREVPLEILLPVVPDQEAPGPPWLIASSVDVQASLTSDGLPLPLDVQVLDDNVFLCAASWTLARPLHPLDVSNGDSGVLALTDELGSRAEHPVRIETAALARTLATLDVSVRRVTDEPHELGTCKSSLLVHRIAFGAYEAELTATSDVVAFLVIEADDAELGQLRTLAATIAPIRGYDAIASGSVPILKTTSDCVTIRVLDWTGELLDLRELCPTAETIAYTLEVEVSAQGVDRAAPAPEASCACTTGPRELGGLSALSALGLLTALSRIRARRR